MKQSVEVYARRWEKGLSEIRARIASLSEEEFQRFMAKWAACRNIREALDWIEGQREEER